MSRFGASSQSGGVTLSLLDSRAPGDWDPDPFWALHGALEAPDNPAPFWINVKEGAPSLCRAHGGKVSRHGPESARGTRLQGKHVNHDIGIAELDPRKQGASTSDTEESDAEGASTSDTEESDAETFPFRLAGWFG